MTKTHRKGVFMFYSILYPRREQHEQPRLETEPDYFGDLNLDQIFQPILTEEKGFGIKEKKTVGLESFFYTPLQDIEAITYRQEVMRELEDENLRAMFNGFAYTVYGIQMFVGMVHDALTSLQRWRDNYITRGQLLDCVERYIAAVDGLCAALAGMNLCSDGLKGFAGYLKDYAASDAFTGMRDHAKKLREQLSTVEYCMLIKHGVIRVRRYEGQADRAKDILATFSKFSQGQTRDFKFHVTDESRDMRMEAIVLNMVAAYYKDIFADLDKFCEKYYNFIDETVSRFAREVQFYLSWLDYIAPLRQSGLQFCYPTIKNDARALYCRAGFDLALAYRMRGEPGAIVPNDFELNAPERILVITGPNQGGKTTFARAFGQMHHLASLGLCVPGREAALYLFDTILTHFEREEDINTLNGKLQDDLVRLRDLLVRATSRSIVIINEIFVSTTLTDALTLGTRMMDALAAKNVIAVVVTFLDELATHGPETVSMMTTVDPEDPARRLFKIIRKPPDGLAYAMFLSSKHGLTYEQLSGRLKKK
jgi:DNA mismatch repair protein MutS